MPGQVEIKDLTKRYGDTLAVDAVNLTVKQAATACSGRLAVGRRRRLE